MYSLKNPLALPPVALLLIAAISCNSSNRSTKNIQYKMGDFDYQGHRGCRGLMPENTVPAFINALSTPTTTLELDVVISKDNKVVVSHEPFFNHEISTKPDGSFVSQAEERSLNIYRMEYADVKKFDVGSRFHPKFPEQQKLKTYKPLLSDVFDSVKNDMITRRRPFPFYNIETKCRPETDNIFHPGPQQFVDLLMQVIRENQMEDYVTIQSFDFRTLQYLHQKYPNIKTAMLIAEADSRSFRKQLDDLGFTPTIYSPAYKLVTANLIEECHKRNIKIIPWTVNDKTEIERLKKLGVDGIISDYPNRF